MDVPAVQPTVYELCDAKYGLYYWIYLRTIEGKAGKEEANIVAKICSRIHETANGVDESLKVGVGFGKRMLKLIQDNGCETPDKPKPMTKIQHGQERLLQEEENLKNWKAKIKGLQQSWKVQLDKLQHPNFNLNEANQIKDTGGDVFVHVKGNSVGNLYAFQHLFHNSIEGFIDEKETTVTLGFEYQQNKDISGYPLGATNPTTNDERRSAAVVLNTGGSYAITQRWEHKMNVIRVGRPHSDFGLVYANKVPKHQRVGQHDVWIGCKRENGEVLEHMEHTSHVYLMQSVIPKIVRQSLPYIENARGGETPPATGLFFLAYANDTEVFNTMLGKMANGPDMLFQMSQCKTGTFWYFPGMKELEKYKDYAQTQDDF